MRVVAIDPGSANTGIATAEDGRITRVAYFSTAMGPRRGKRAPDDIRRLLEMARDIREYLEEEQPDEVTVEWYAPRGDMKASSGWKTILVVGACAVIARRLGVTCSASYPGTVAAVTGVPGSGPAAKEARCDWARANLPGFATLSAGFSKSHCSHVMDASVHAMYTGGWVQ